MRAIISDFYSPFEPLDNESLACDYNERLLTLVRDYIKRVSVLPCMATLHTVGVPPSSSKALFSHTNSLELAIMTFE